MRRFNMNETGEKRQLYLQKIEKNETKCYNLSTKPLPIIPKKM